jgi:hypothetical protein
MKKFLSILITVILGISMIPWNQPGSQSGKRAPRIKNVIQETKERNLLYDGLINK